MGWELVAATSISLIVPFSPFTKWTWLEAGLVQGCTAVRVPTGTSESHSLLCHGIHCIEFHFLNRVCSIPGLLELIGLESHSSPLLPQLPLLYVSMIPGAKSVELASVSSMSSSHNVLPKMTMLHL